MCLVPTIEKRVLRRYKIFESIGKGAYGEVFRGKDRKTGKIVAIKKCSKCFSNKIDAQRVFREVFYLKSLKHVNIISLIDVLMGSDFKDLYLIFPYFPSDLHAVIRGDILHRDLKPSNILIDSDCKINVGDFGMSRGISRGDSPISEPHCSVMTDHVATRWYRAPELLFGVRNYSTAVDIWAVGCLMAELFSGKPLFPGTCSLNQLTRIINLIGYPTDKQISSMKSPYVIPLLESLPISIPPPKPKKRPSLLAPSPLDGRSRSSSRERPSTIHKSKSTSQVLSKTASATRSFTRSLSQEPPTTLHPNHMLSSITSDPELSQKFAYCTPSAHTVNRLRMTLPCAPAEAIDLISRMLLFDPACRITAEDALHHPYLAQFARGEGSAEKHSMSLPVIPVPHLTSPIS
ncbi:hypothetical protein ADUPG1_012284, partial [Aduncisulcus paluster]